MRIDFWVVVALSALLMLQIFMTVLPIWKQAKAFNAMVADWKLYFQQERIADEAREKPSSPYR